MGILNFYKKLIYIYPKIKKDQLGLILKDAQSKTVNEPVLLPDH